MHPIAQFSPYDHYDNLQSLKVPGYQGYPGGEVAVTSYVSANKLFGGNDSSGGLWGIIQEVGKNKSDFGQLQTKGVSRVLSGQGRYVDFIAILSFINKYQSEFRTKPALKKYFQEADFLQAMLDAGVLGMDCIGFVGTYMVEAGIEPTYPERRPLDYCASFTPVKSLDQIKDLAVVMLTNGMHIQIIDEVTARGNGSITVDLCQSASGGPQCNIGVTLKSGGGDFLPVDEFRTVLANKKYDDDWKKDNEARKAKGLAPRVYEMYLRERLKQPNTLFGYGGGAIFQLIGNGDPKNPVGGSVYVGYPKSGLSVKTPNSGN